MIDFGLIYTGLVIGFVVAAPIGPVNLICIRRTLAFGGTHGFMVGIGAAFGDGLFALVAAFGITAAIDFVMAYEAWIQVLGGLFLLGLGVRTWSSEPHLAAVTAGAAPAGLLGVVGSTFVLTITNPATMLGFIAIFGGVSGLASLNEDYGRAALLVAAVMCGSLLWWAGVSAFVNLFRARMTDRLLNIVNKISGVLIGGFGAVVLGRVIWRLLA